MDFFNDLLTSYALLKKRKFSASIDLLKEYTGKEGKSRAGEPSREPGEAPNFGDLKDEGDEKKIKDKVIEELEAIFPGIDGSLAGAQLGGQKVTSIDQSIQAASKFPAELQLRKGGTPVEEPSDTTTTPKVTTSDSTPAKKVGDGKPCGGGIMWEFNSTLLVFGNCSTSPQLKDYRNALSKYIFGGGAVAGEFGEGATPEGVYFGNSEQGRILNETLSKHLKAGNLTQEEEREARKHLMQLMSRGGEVDAEGKWVANNPFFDPELKTSIFGVLNHTFENASRGEWEDTGILKKEDVEASPVQALGALTAMIKAMDIAGKNLSDISQDDRDYMRDNLKLVKQREKSGGAWKEVLYFNAGGEGNWITFTTEPKSRSKKAFQDIFITYNELLDKDDSEDSKIPVEDLLEAYRLTPAAHKANLATTEVTEELDQLQLMVTQADELLGTVGLAIDQETPGKKTPSEVKDIQQRVARAYVALRKKWGDNIGRVLAISDEALEAGGALTDEWEGVKAWVEQYEEAFGGPSFEAFARKMMTLRQDPIRKSGADFIHRVGGGGQMFGLAGDNGFLSDQVYLFRDKDKARKFQGARGFSETPVSLKELVEGGFSKTALKEDPDVGKKAWKEFKKKWNVESDDEQVYIGYESLKCNTTDRVNYRKQPGPHKISETMSTELNGLRTAINDPDPEVRTAYQESHAGQWMAGMTGDGMFGSDAHLDAVIDNFDSMDQHFQNLEMLQNGKSPSLSPTQVQAELWAAIGADENPLKITEDDISTLIGAGGAGSAREELEKKGLVRKLHKAIFLGSLRQGLGPKKEGESASQAKARIESWKHTTALIMMRGGFDRNWAQDASIFPKEDRYTQTGRNQTIKKVLGGFMGSDNPLALDKIKFDTQQFSIPSGQGVLSYKTGSGGKGKEAQSTTEYRPPKPTNDSIEYTPTEIMNKLLEVQELMFSHLIKE